MFLTMTPEGKIYKELATDHFADPTGLGKYALFLRPLPARDAGGAEPLRQPRFLRLL